MGFLKQCSRVTGILVRFCAAHNLILAITPAPTAFTEQNCTQAFYFSRFQRNPQVSPSTDNKLGDAGVWELARALATNRSLTTLTSPV